MSTVNTLIDFDINNAELVGTVTLPSLEALANAMDRFLIGSARLLMHGGPQGGWYQVMYPCPTICVEISDGGGYDVGVYKNGQGTNSKDAKNTMELLGYLKKYAQK